MSTTVIGLPSTPSFLFVRSTYVISNTGARD